MQIQFNSDHSIHASRQLAERVEADLRKSLARFADWLTRIEVHVSDVNAGKGGDSDKRCQMEARLAGRQPISVNESSATLGQAIHLCSAKLERALDSAVGKLEDARHAAPRAGGEIED